MNERRPNSHARGYDADWRRVRAAHLAAEPLCRFCLHRGRVTPATDVDHIVSVAEAPHLRLVDDNLRSLCHTCHSRRTARDQGFARGSKRLESGCDERGVPSDPRHHWHGQPEKSGTSSERPSPLFRVQSRETGPKRY